MLHKEPLWQNHCGRLVEYYFCALKKKHRLDANEVQTKKIKKKKKKNNKVLCVCVYLTRKGSVNTRLLCVVVMAANQNMLNNSHPQNHGDELNFTAFTDLCRFCSLRIGPKIHLFEKEAEQRQILYKIRSFLPVAVNTDF